MQNKYGYFILFLGLLFYLTGCKREQPTPPNVIIIMTDDQGYGDVAANGNPFVETRNMDRLHDEAVRLEDFHVAPTCSPTRAQLMTGKYNHRVGVWHTVIGRERISKSELTIANAFASNGYATGIFGKWHLGDDYPFRPSDRGFQESVIPKSGSVSQAADYWNNDRMSDTYYDNNEPKKYTGFSTDVFFKEATSFIKENKDRPFFAYIPTSTPHGPNNILQVWADKYLKKGLDENVSNFYASIERVDFNIGQLRQYLKESGLEKNTRLIFLTDNGTAMPNKHNGAGMRGSKGSVYEGGHRVPCFVYWPQTNIMGGLEYHGLTSVMDLFPTLIDLCDLKMVEQMKFDGISLKSMLYGKELENERYLIAENQRIPKPIKWRNCALMHEKWRLINAKELYNMENDFGQQHDVAEQYPEIVQNLRAKYELLWDDISANDDKYHPLILGSSKTSKTLLTAQDWYWQNNNDKQKLVVAQEAVREGVISNGIWPVEIAKEGDYLFELRRWPKESGLALNASAPEIKSEGNDIELKKWGGKPLGRIFNITRAKLKVDEAEKVVDVDPSLTSATIPLHIKKGKAKIQTWFYTSEGDTLGAYYVNVRLLE